MIVFDISIFLCGFFFSYRSWEFFISFASVCSTASSRRKVLSDRASQVSKLLPELKGFSPMVSFICEGRKDIAKQDSKRQRASVMHQYSKQKDSQFNKSIQYQYSSADAFSLTSFPTWDRKMSFPAGNMCILDSLPTFFHFE